MALKNIHPALVQTTITKQHHKELKDAASQEGLTVASLLRRMIMQWSEVRARRSPGVGKS
jgi:hypothetical protein